MNDFTVCQGGQCRHHEAQRLQQPGSESAGIVQRLEALMRRCREEGHRVTYQDLLQVRERASRG